MNQPSRGEIWDLDLDPVRGREQAGRRPALVVSVDRFNEGPADLLVIVPLTRTDRHIPWQVSVDPPEGGLVSRSFLKCEDVRSISKVRLVRRRGRIHSTTMEEVEERLRILLGL